MKKLREIILVCVFCLIGLIGISQNYPNIQLIGAMQDSLTDNTQILFVPGATGAWDSKYDGYKIPNSDLSVPTIYTEDTQGHWLSVNAVPAIVYNVFVSIPVYFDAGEVGTSKYYLKVGLMNNFTNSTKIYLIDTKTSDTTNLRTTTTYKFTVTGSDINPASARFTLLLYEESPLIGVYTIKASGGDYSSFTSAITDLNFRGIGGAVTFNVDANLVTLETSIPAITTIGTSAWPIIFQKSGAGANPIIQSAGTIKFNDAGIVLKGCQYITFNGIDVNAVQGNTSLEYGYYVINADTSHGAQYNTIKNCNIILNRNNYNSIGIYQHIVTIPTSLAGTNSYNKYYNITVQNSYWGIYLFGNTKIHDTGCEIGTEAGGTTTIGGSTAGYIGGYWDEVDGVEAAYQNSVKIFNITVSNLSVTFISNNYTNTVNGINLTNCDGNNIVENNTISGLSCGDHSANKITAIGILLNILTGSTVSCTNNTITLTKPASTLSAGIVQVNGTDTINTLNVSGGNYGVAVSGGNAIISKSTIANNSNGILLSGGAIQQINGTNITSNSVYGIYVTGGMVTDSIYASFISGNGKWGINNTTTDTIIALNNWWGDITGPYSSINNIYTNTGGLGDTVSNYVKFSPWLHAGITASGPTTVCSPLSVGLTAIPQGAAYTYLWLVNTKSTGINNFYYTANVAGSYSCVVYDNGTNIGTSNAITVTINPDLVVSVTISASANPVCPGTAVTYTANPVNAGTNPTYQWQVNKANAGTYNSTFTYAPSNTDTVTCIVTSSLPCISNSPATSNKIGMTVAKVYISGYVKYENANTSAMTNTKVYIKNSAGDTLGETVTDLTGYYKISNLVNGTYNLSCSTIKRWGGANPIDALMVDKAYVHLIKLTDPLKKLASDVNDDGKINPIDALMIDKRYVRLVNQFNISDWLFSNPTVLIDNVNVSQNISALCAGDVRGYDTPSAQRVTLSPVNYAGILNITPNTAFDIPVYLNDNSELGALGIKFNIQSSKFKVTGIRSDIGGLIYNISDNEIDIAWTAEEAGYSITPDRPIFVLQAICSEPTSNMLQITSESELADIDANTISTDKLVMPELTFSNSAVSFSCYPNPFNNITNINYTIPQDANVVINLYNVLGEKIACLTNASQQAGNHNLQYNGSSLNQGIYYCRFDIQNGNTSYTNTNILMIAR